MIVHIGNGATVNAWEDPWLPCGPLITHISYRQVHALGFNPKSTAREVIDYVNGSCPNTWLEVYPALASIPIPTYNDGPDVMKWKNNLNEITSYTVKDAWNSMEGNHPTVAWTKSVWFKAYIPKHAFCLWIACHNRLPTQDRIQTWKVETPDMNCIFCGIGPDSHSHLFFECNFPKRCWRGIKLVMGFQNFAENWHDIKEALSYSRLKTIQKLSLAAAVYFI